MQHKQKRVLVTGGAGYIGSHACKALVAAGYTPITYDNLVYGHPWAVKWGPLEKGDILDRARLDEVISTYRPEAVMHFAAYAYVGESVKNPGKYYQNNVAGTLNLLEAMRDHQVDKFIFSSSCATYGLPEEIPISEDHPQFPINPYGHSKLMVEQILKDFHAAHGIRSISLRYFNAAGADSECEIGEMHDPETHLIPLILDVAAQSRPYITIYGDDYDTPDGTCIRDYIHVSDIATAHILAMEKLKSQDDACAYNLGNGNGFSVKEVVDIAREVSKCHIPVKIGLRRAGDPHHLVGDATRMQNELGWESVFPDLPSIIETAWRWHKRNFKSKKYARSKKYKK